MQHVFLIGAKSLGTYGGYETFISKLTEYHQNDTRIKYHVAVKENGEGAMNPSQTDGVYILNEREFIYHNAHCFRVHVPEKIGPAKAVYYDIMAIKKCLEIISESKIAHPIVYVMACRIGPFFPYYVEKIHKLGGKVVLNPDGHEWLRAKWNRLIRMYWKKSEQIMVTHSDLIICDSITIEKYIHKAYDGKCNGNKKTTTTFIAYGAETRLSSLTDESIRFVRWLEEKELKPNGYYLVVGRFVPENNYEIMIREFMKSKSDKDFAIVTNVNNAFLYKLEKNLGYSSDKRIKFVGTVYDQELLMKIRENAFAYFHGHEVGGTNPSLLEALGSTKMNLLLDVGFNREVAQNAALYWTKEDGSLAKLIDEVDQYSDEIINELGKAAKERIRSAYSWKYICDRYADVWLANC